MFNLGSVPQFSLDREKFGAMLEDYYRMRGWDALTGIPRPERLEALGLEDIAQDMRKY